MGPGIDWFILRGGRFERHACNEGVFRSEVFPGLWLDVDALISGDTAQVMNMIQQGIATDAHREFVQRIDPENQSAK